MPSNTKRRKNGQIAASSLERRIASGDDLPADLEPRPGEHPGDWLGRIRCELMRETLLDSIRYRGEAFGWHYRQHVLDRAWPARQEIDVTARQDDWLRNLTAEELEALDDLRQAAIKRAQTPDVVVSTDQVEAISQGDGK